MKLEEYISDLQNLVKEHPEYLNFKVVYAADDEGNQFNPLNHSPSLGNYEKGEFTPDDGTEEFTQQCKINSICIN